MCASSQSSWELGSRDKEFKASLGYTSVLKGKKYHYRLESMLVSVWQCGVLDQYIQSQARNQHVLGAIWLLIFTDLCLNRPLALPIARGNMVLLSFTSSCWHLRSDGFEFMKLLA